MENKTLCIFGRLHPSYEKNHKLPETYYGEMILDILDHAKPAKVKAPFVNKYPAVSRDISIVVKDEIKASEIISAIKKSGGSLVKNIRIFDIYQGEHIEKGYKSVSISITYEDKEKTLKVEDVNPVNDKILADLKDRFEAIQR